jgi:hypothetical protein
MEAFVGKSLKLSEIKEHLQKCERIMSTFHLLADSNGFGSTSACIYFGQIGSQRNIVINDDQITEFDQALIVAALEQFVESRGYWFDFEKKPYVPYFDHYATLLKFNGRFPEKVKQYYAPTRLQAALECFLAVDWGKA